MDGWKDAWVIFKKDLYSDRFYLIWNVIFMLYVSLMLGSLVGARERSGFVMNPMSDFLMLTMVPFTGFFFSRRSFSYIKEDSYTQMLRYYRVLPIPLKTVMRSRLIQLGVALLANGILFYSALYLVTFLMDGAVAPGPYIVFAITWSGYGLLINGIFIYCEFLKKGKVYLWLTFLLMILLGVVAFATGWLGGNFLSFTLDISQRYVLLSPLMWGTLVVGVLGLALLNTVTLRKLAKRDLG